MKINVGRFSNDFEYLNEIENLVTKIDEGINLLCSRLIEESPNELKDLFKFFKDYALRPGKRIRPILLVLTYKGYGGENEKEALKLGSVVEMMHSFLLVHDDIIDNSVLRRGEPTLHKVYENIFNSPKLGIDTAIVVGDLISFFSVGIISELNVGDKTKRELLRSFSNCYVKTCFGQLLDIITSNRINDEYIRSNIPKKISEMKTAYYTFIYPMILGYYLSEKDEKIEKSKEGEFGNFREIELMENVGLHAGIAFQYKDDIIGVFGGDEKTLNDLSEGKLTSVVKKTYENLTGKEKDTFIELIQKQEKRQDDLMVLRNLVIKSKAKEEIIEEINAHKKASLEFLERLDMNIKEKEMIKKIISTVLEID